jgi:hypothetical protein
MSETCANCGAPFDVEQGEPGYRFPGSPPSPEQVNEALRRIPPPDPETVERLAEQLGSHPRIVELVLREEAMIEQLGGVPAGTVCADCAEAWERHYGAGDEG